MDGGVDAPRGGQGGGRLVWDFASRLHPPMAMAGHGHVGETATASLVERRGEGVDRRAARQEPLAGAVGHGTTGRAPPPIEAAVETVSG